MAGAGYKLFATGDVLTAAQVNTYLMQQTVMVFASSAARTTALSGVLAEGMVSYLQDSNTLEVYDGSAWVGATGDITGLTAGTGISISSATGPVPTVTNSMATEITAKGDLIVGTGSGTFDNLAAGSNGDTIVADSSTSTGLRWQGSTEAGKNFVINGGMDIWQRGTSIVTNSGSIYTADRWACGNNASSTSTRQTTGLAGFQYCLRNARNSGATATTNINMVSSFETVNVIPLQGKTVTLSFYARAGANYSGASNVLNVQLEQGTGTDQSLWTGMTGSSGVIIAQATLTTSWQRFTYTGTVNSASTALSMNLYYAPTGTAGAADYYEVTGVQLEIGSVATTFSRAGGTIQGELAAAQRYYWRLTKNDGILGHMYKYLTGDGMAFIQHPVPMRVTPTSLDILNVQFQQTNLTNNAIIGPALNSQYSTNLMGAFTFGQTGLANGTQGYAALTSSAYVGFSAEL